MKNKVMVLSFFGEPMAVGDIFLSMVENNALYHVPVGTVFQLDGAPPHISHHFHAFLD
jgi:hypothetical protein